MDDRFPYRLRDLCALGATRAQLRHWERKGHIRPLRQGGGWRRYSEEEYQRVRRIHCLIRKGLRLSAAVHYEGALAQREAGRAAANAPTPPCAQTPTAMGQPGQAPGT